MNSDAGSTQKSRALVVIPGTVNYFYNQSGHRIADSLRELGFDVDVSTLGSLHEGDYALCVLSSITEILFAFGDEAAGLWRIRELRRRCGAMTSCGIDCVATPWYHRLHDMTVRAGVETIIDLGLHDQGHALAPGHRSMYRFVFSGLSPSERRQLSGLDEDAERTIPWAFVGHNTPHRVALVDHLIQTVDPRGFVYMPTLSVYTETGSPHLNQEQFETVLRHTRYQVWCSHHSHFYMEPERFRNSLLTGGIPIKVVGSRHAIPHTAPLGYLMMEAGEVGARLTPGVFRQVRRRFFRDWLEFPTLSEGLYRFLDEAGMLPGDLVLAGETVEEPAESHGTGQTHRVDRGQETSRPMSRIPHREMS